jgi:prepilin-type N-terminal cleavage/methylation domain-containing protein
MKHEFWQSFLRMKRVGQENGFTLIELLVVIAVVGMLAALLLPALSISKHHGSDLNCVSNLKQVTSAGLMYLDDAKQGMLECDTYGNIQWMGRLLPYGCTSKLLLCPVTHLPTVVGKSGGFTAGTASSSWYAWPDTCSSPFNGSYSMNGWFFSYDPNITNVSGWISPPPTPVVKNPQFVFNKPTWVQRPAQTPLFNDAVYMDEWPLESDPPAPDLSTGAYNNIMGMPRCTIWRHGGTTAVARTPPGHSTTPPYFTFPGSAAINIGFDDGHAQQVKLKDLWQLNWHQNWGSD